MIALVLGSGAEFDDVAGGVGGGGAVGSADESDVHLLAVAGGFVDDADGSDGSVDADGRVGLELVGGQAFPVAGR